VRKVNYKKFRRRRAKRHPPKLNTALMSVLLVVVSMNLSKVIDDTLVALEER
jgi:hypothetical protein